MKITIANYNEHYVVDLSTKNERDIKFCLVQKIGGENTIKESDVIIIFNYSDDEEYFKVEKNIPNLSNDEIEKLVNEFKSSDLYKPDFRYIVIDYDAGCISKTNNLTDDIKGMINQGYYRVIDLKTMETIDSNKNILLRKEITIY